MRKLCRVLINCRLTCVCQRIGLHKQLTGPSSAARNIRLGRKLIQTPKHPAAHIAESVTLHTTLWSDTSL